MARVPFGTGLPTGPVVSLQHEPETPRTEGRRLPALPSAGETLCRARSPLGTWTLIPRVS